MELLNSILYDTVYHSAPIILCVIGGIFAYKANVISNREIKISTIEECIAKVKIIDFLLNLCYDKHIINSNKYIKFGAKIDDILKYMVGWLKTINLEKNRA